MKKLVVSLGLVGLAATPAAALNVGTCYLREYSAGHLITHRDQEVTFIALMMSDAQSGGGIVNYDLQLKLRRSDETYQGVAYCEETSLGLYCGMEGDGGGFNVSYGGDGGKIMITLDKGGISVEGGNDFAALSGVRGDDREFVLSPCPQ